MAHRTVTSARGSSLDVGPGTAGIVATSREAGVKVVWKLGGRERGRRVLCRASPVRSSIGMTAGEILDEERLARLIDVGRGLTAELDLDRCSIAFWRPRAS
jgi:hypothetical protein